MQTERLSPSKILFYFCIFFIIGVFIESLLDIPQTIVCGILFLGLIFVFISIINKRIHFIFGFCFLIFCIAISRMQIAEFKSENDKLKSLNGQQIELTGFINSDPDKRDNYQKIKVRVGNSTILVTTGLEKDFQYLDKVSLFGELQEPQETEDFSYKKYLLKDGIYSVMFFPKIEIISKIHKYNLLSFVYEKILIIKSKVRASIEYSFFPPESSILEGTILGDNGAMSEELKTKLNTTGLRHVIAVSGTHVVILSSIIMSLLIIFGLKRTNAFYFAIVIIFFYVIFTGFPASGVRAGIMGGLYLLAQQFGRQSNGLRIIVLSAALMVGFNPWVLVFDIGFQLSFLAVLGLIYLEPPFTLAIKSLLKKIIKKDYNFDEFIKIISATFAAQVFTLPIMLYSFGNISLVSPITNLLILPVVYWLMIFGFVCSFVGVFSNWLGWILAIPCYLLLEYFLWIINFFSKPWCIKTFENVHWAWLIILYFPIIILSKILSKKASQKF